MEESNGKPFVGSGSGQLGVRVGGPGKNDITPNPQGEVSPVNNQNTPEGMSVNPDIASTPQTLLPAYWFLCEAFRREPTNFHYRTLALLSLSRINPKTALSEVKEILVSDQEPIVKIFGAAQVAFNAANRITETDAKEIYQTIVERLEIALQREERVEIEAPLLLSANLNLAAALELLGNNEAAKKAYDKTVEQHPESIHALLLRAVFLLRVEPTLAKQELERLVQKQIPFVEAYFYLAPEVLKEKDFGRCLKLCEQTLQRRPYPEMMPYLWEWKAICLAELGHAPQTVKAYFMRASEADPFNENIRRNLAVFEKRLTQHTPTPEYDIPAVAIPSTPEFLARMAA